MRSVFSLSAGRKKRLVAADFLQNSAKQKKVQRRRLFGKLRIMAKTLTAICANCKHFGQIEDTSKESVCGNPEIMEMTGSMLLVKPDFGCNRFEASDVPAEKVDMEFD